MTETEKLLIQAYIEYFDKPCADHYEKFGNVGPVDHMIIQSLIDSGECISLTATLLAHIETCGDLLYTVLPNLERNQLELIFHQCKTYFHKNVVKDQFCDSHDIVLFLEALRQMKQMLNIEQQQDTF